MPEYALKRNGRTVEEEEDKEKVVKEPKRILGKAMKEAWMKPEMTEMREKLSDVATKYWKPQIEEALKATGYAKELEGRAREIRYDKKVKEVWK